MPQELSLLYVVLEVFVVIINKTLLFHVIVVVTYFDEMSVLRVVPLKNLLVHVIFLIGL